MVPMLSWMAAGQLGKHPVKCSLEVAFRVDASLDIGTGHVMRCLALADALREEGAKCHFICRPHAGHLATHIESKGHRVTLLPVVERVCGPMIAPAHAAWLGCDWRDDAKQTIAAVGDQQPEWFVVDHYALDAQWENEIRLHCQRLLVIDDLADRTHYCDLLLDQNLGREPSDYERHVKTDARFLIGPTYALLRPEFAHLREYSLARRRNPKLAQLLISMGGIDQPNITGQVLQALCECRVPDNFHVIVVLGEHAPWAKRIKQLATDLPFHCEVLTNVSNMALLMADSDLAIGAAGSTSWERCCLGVPSIALVAADNQSAVAAALETLGAAVVVQRNLLRVSIIDVINRARKSTDLLTQLTERTAALVDGLGAPRVASFMRKAPNSCL